jgi:hypothetical protein
MRIGAAFVLLAFAVALLRFAIRRPSSNFAVLSGGCLALAAWAAPPSLAFAPMLAAPLFDRRWPFRARAHVFASALLGLGLVLLPWALRRA